MPDRRHCHDCPGRTRDRTGEAVCEAIGALLDTYTAEECANYFKHSGYGSA